MTWLTFMALFVLLTATLPPIDGSLHGVPFGDDDLPPPDAALSDDELDFQPVDDGVLREGRETPVEANPPASGHVVSLRIRADVAADGERAFWVEAIGADGEGVCIIEAPTLEEVMEATESLVDLGDPRLTFDQGATM